MKKCPYCAEEIQDEAVKCKHCGSDLASASSRTPATVQERQEVSYYSDSAIQVTSARAILPGKTYAMANITSVSLGSIPPRRLWAIVVIVLGAIWTFAPPHGAGVTTFGVIVLALGIFLLVRARVRYVVKLGSASGEMDAFASKDRRHVEKIVAAINKAIVDRG